MAESGAPEVERAEPFAPLRISPSSLGTTAIFGVSDHGPLGLHPREFASRCEFEAAYEAQPAALWQAVRGYFDNGGRRLRVVRLPARGPGHEADERALTEGLAQLESVDDVGVLCAPGVRLAQGHERLCELLLRHCDARRDRIALLDAPRNTTLADARALRDRLDSRYGVLYYPWVMAAVDTDQDSTAVETDGSVAVPVPPSAHIAGIFADHDDEPGTYKSPMSMPIVGAIGLERPIDDDVYDLLGPLGINVLRVLPGRQGAWLWGGRTLSEDEWNYVAVRRYLIYLERSLERGLRAVTFEPPGEALWRRVAASVAHFLHSEWRSGALIGATPEEAYTVCCDRTTMTAAEIDAGHVVVMLGVALIEPSEFILLRIEISP